MKKTICIAIIAALVFWGISPSMAQVGVTDGCQEDVDELMDEINDNKDDYTAESRRKAKKHLLDAYTSVEGFFDPASEKRAMSLWGAEVEKVYKGEPYEQATLSLLVGLLLLEDGDVDNALACFKNGQISDSDVEEELFKSDYGLLQLLEAKCHQMRGEQTEYDQFVSKAVDSFAKTHPFLVSKEPKFLLRI